MKKNLLIISILSLLLFNIFFVLPVLAISASDLGGVAGEVIGEVTGQGESNSQKKLSNQVMGQVNVGAGSAGYDTGENAKTLQQEIVGIVIIGLMILGTLFLALLVYAGFVYFTAQGDEEKNKKALDIAKGAVIGFAIVMLSYSITLFIGTKLTGNEVNFNQE